MAEEDIALAEFINQLESEPSSGSEGGVVPALTAPGPDIPALREQLAVLVSTDKAKEARATKMSRNTPNATRHTWVQRQQTA